MRCGEIYGAVKQLPAEAMRTARLVAHHITYTEEVYRRLRIPRRKATHCWPRTSLFNLDKTVANFLLFANKFNKLPFNEMRT